MIHKYDPNVGNYYATQTKQQRKKYGESFGKILYLLSEDDKMLQKPGDMYKV